MFSREDHLYPLDRGRVHAASDDKVKPLSTLDGHRRPEISPSGPVTGLSPRPSRTTHVSSMLMAEHPLPSIPIRRRSPSRNILPHRSKGVFRVVRTVLTGNGFISSPRSRGGTGQDMRVCVRPVHRFFVVPAFVDLPVSDTVPRGGADILSWNRSRWMAGSWGT